MTAQEEIEKLESLLSYLQQIIEERRRNTWEFSDKQSACLIYRSMLNAFLDKLFATPKPNQPLR
jgi:hypothetical protein